MKRSFYTVALLVAFLLAEFWTTPEAHAQAVPPGSWDEEGGLLTLRFSPGEGHRVRRITKRVDRDDWIQGAEKTLTTTEGVDERLIEYADITPAGPGRVSMFTLRDESKTRNPEGTLLDDVRSELHGRVVRLSRKEGAYKLVGEHDLYEGLRSFLESEADWPASFFPAEPVKKGATWTLEKEALKRALGLGSIDRGKATVKFVDVVMRGDKECAVLKAKMEYGSRDEFGVSDVKQEVTFTVWIKHGYPLAETWTGTDRTENPDEKETYLTKWKNEVTGELELPEAAKTLSAAETLAHLEAKIRNCESLRAEIETLIVRGKPETATLHLLVKKGDRIKIEVETEKDGPRKLVVVSDGTQWRGSGSKPKPVVKALIGLNRLITFSVGRIGILSGWMMGVPTAVDPDEAGLFTLENRFRVGKVRHGMRNPESGVLHYEIEATGKRQPILEVLVEYDPRTFKIKSRKVRAKGDEPGRFQVTEIFKTFEYDPDFPDALFGLEEK